MEVFYHKPPTFTAFLPPNTLHKSNHQKMGVSDHFSTDDGVEAVEIFGDVRPILGVIQEVKENLLTEYPLSATEVAKAVKKQLPNISRNKVWETLKNNEMKNNRDYSAYNFRNKGQEELYKESGKLPSGTPSIYNHKAVDFIVATLKNQESTSQTNDQNL